MRRAILLVAAIMLVGCGGDDAGVELTGGEIAFTVNDNGWGEIWLMAPDGSDRRRLTDSRPSETDASGATSPAWSPDGTRIAYSAQTGTEEEDQRLSEIYVMNADGTGQERLTTNDDFDGDPVWSPDGTRIAFTRATGVGTDAVRSGIAVMDAVGGSARQITRARGSSFDGTPAWSPDGSRIVFTRATFGERSEDATFDLFTVGPDGTGLKKIVPGGGDPSWSPDGTRIAYASIRDRLGITCFQECLTSGEIYVAEADGSGQRRLTRTEADEGSPAWSPDGRRIAFVSDESNRQEHEHEIYVMNAGGSKVRRLTQNQVWDLEPAWRPR